MKIIQVQTQAEAAGSQRISEMVGAGLSARGHDVRTVFMYRKTDAYDHDPKADFILKSAPGGILSQAKAAFGLMRYLRQEAPDAIITYQLWGNFFGALGGKLAGTKTIIANQSGQPVTRGLSGLVSKLDRVIGALGFYDVNVINSDWNATQFAHYPEAYRKRLHKIAHGVLGPDRAYDKQLARTAFDLPQNAPLVISIGRLTPEKNQDALIDVLAKLPKIHVAIAGVGPSHEALIAKAEKLGVRQRLHLIGEVSPEKIFEFIAAGDVFAFPSLYETFGLSPAEAALSGLPVVTYDLPVFAEVLVTTDGRSAALFAPLEKAQENSLADAIAQILEDPALYARLSIAGRDLAQKHSPEVMCAAYENLLPKAARS